jgi:response regulator NasT
MKMKIFWNILELAIDTQIKLQEVQKENRELKQKIENIRIIDRAKCILISRLNLSEEEAHRAIEKQAMDMRASKRAIAEGILKTYEG